MTAVHSMDQGEKLIPFLLQFDEDPQHICGKTSNEI